MSSSTTTAATMIAATTATTTIAWEWEALPVELRLSVFSELEPSDVRALGRTSKQTHALSVAFAYKDVSLNTNQLACFLAHVPTSRTSHVRTLTLTTATSTPGPEGHIQKRGWTAAEAQHHSGYRTESDALAALLHRCTRLQTLDLSLAHSLSARAVPAFARLRELRSLAIANVGSEEEAPICERLVVSIALSVPSLTRISLTRITRSAKTCSPSLLGTRVPLTSCASSTTSPDEILSPTDTPLSLPSLLRLPHLTSLSIQDTHLGDDGWICAPLSAPLEELHLGASAHEAPCASQAHAERILSNPGICGSRRLRSLSLSTPLSSSTTTTPTPDARLGLASTAEAEESAESDPSVASECQETVDQDQGRKAESQAHPHPRLRLPALQTLTLTSSFPLLSFSPSSGSSTDSPLHTTLSTLAQGSALATLNVRCHEDDVEDWDEALQEYLERAAEGAAPKAVCLMGEPEDVSLPRVTKMISKVTRASEL